MVTSAALAKAVELGVDLIEISPAATPPVAKIMEFGKWQYEENKKTKGAVRHSAETKQIQVKLATGEHDLALKAKKASELLKIGNRVKVELYLSGRAKYLDQKFLRERLERVLKLISEDYKISDEIRVGPKGMSLVIERAKK